MHHGRKSACLKASYDAVSAALQEMGFDKELVGGDQMAAVQDGVKKSKKKRYQKRKGTPAVQGMDVTALCAVEMKQEEVGVDPFPGEPTYCSCNQVSYGNMVACDNKDCRIEWFHYSCVGILTPPKGTWYCPECAVALGGPVGAH